MPTATKPDVLIPDISSLKGVSDQQLTKELSAAIKKLAKEKSSSRRVYVVFAGDDILLDRIKLVVPEVRSEVEMSYLVYIHDGQALGMTKFDIGGYEVYLSVGSDY